MSAPETPDDDRTPASSLYADCAEAIAIEFEDGELITMEWLRVKLRIKDPDFAEISYIPPVEQAAWARETMQKQQFAWLEAMDGLRTELLNEYKIAHQERARAGLPAPAPARTDQRSAAPVTARHQPGLAAESIAHHQHPARRPRPTRPPGKSGSPRQAGTAETDVSGDPAATHHQRPCTKNRQRPSARKLAKAA